MNIATTFLHFDEKKTQRRLAFIKETHFQSGLPDQMGFHFFKGLLDSH